MQRQNFTLAVSSILVLVEQLYLNQLLHSSFVFQTKQYQLHFLNLDKSTVLHFQALHLQISIRTQPAPCLCIQTCSPDRRWEGKKSKMPFPSVQQHILPFFSETKDAIPGQAAVCGLLEQGGRTRGVLQRSLGTSAIL